MDATDSQIVAKVHDSLQHALYESNFTENELRQMAHLLRIDIKGLETPEELRRELVNHLVYLNESLVARIWYELTSVSAWKVGQEGPTWGIGSTWVSRIAKTTALYIGGVYAANKAVDYYLSDKPVQRKLVEYGRYVGLDAALMTTMLAWKFLKWGSVTVAGISAWNRIVPLFMRPAEQKRILEIINLVDNSTFKQLRRIDRCQRVQGFYNKQLSPWCEVEITGRDERGIPQTYRWKPVFKGVGASYGKQYTRLYEDRRVRKLQSLALPTMRRMKDIAHNLNLDGPQQPQAVPPWWDAYNAILGMEELGGSEQVNLATMSQFVILGQEIEAQIRTARQSRQVPPRAWLRYDEQYKKLVDIYDQIVPENWRDEGTQVEDYESRVWWHKAKRYGLAVSLVAAVVAYFGTNNLNHYLTILEQSHKYATKNSNLVGQAKDLSAAEWNTLYNKFRLEYIKSKSLALFAFMSLRQTATQHYKTILAAMISFFGVVKASKYHREYQLIAAEVENSEDFQQFLQTQHSDDEERTVFRESVLDLASPWLGRFLRFFWYGQEVGAKAWAKLRGVKASTVGVTLSIFFIFFGVQKAVFYYNMYRRIQKEVSSDPAYLAAIQDQPKEKVDDLFKFYIRQRAEESYWLSRFLDWLGRGGKVDHTKEYEQLANTLTSDAQNLNQ